jgi:TusA-related sulfurtransferase
LEAKITHKFDLRKAITPFTFLKITQAFREMKTGEILQVNGNDAKTRKEILKVLNTFHYTVVDTEENGNFYCICLKKES